MRAGLALILALALAPVATAAEPARDLRCEASDGTEFSIALWSASSFDMPLHCVLGLDLGVVGPCAPDGGWGLSDPAGSGELAAIATDAREIDHVGGKFFARVGSSELVASASIGTRIPYALEVAGETFWRLRMTLATGEGALVTAEGETTFACEGG